jgi:hypothetical protein
MITVLEFLAAWFVGWVASFILLIAYENEHPKCEDVEIQRQISKAFKKLNFRFGLITAVVWLIYFSRWKHFFLD